MLGLMAGLPAGADVARAKTPPVIDGRLDDALVMDLIGESFRLTKKK